MEANIFVTGLCLVLMSTLDVSQARLFTPIPQQPRQPRQPQNITQVTFKVAVFDQATFTMPPAPFANVTRQEALVSLYETLHMFAHQAAKAATSGADMIIFAEYGLVPRGTTYQSVLPYLETIADPTAFWNPCVEPLRHSNTEIQHFLSCIAMNNSLYVVANMGDVVYCGNTYSQRGRLQYNTNVVYDPRGTHIARYHKQHLFFESHFDTPTTPEFSYFDTPFGRFGTFVCFDVLFEKPALMLIKHYKIDHVAFPTAWMNVFPYFSAVTFHQSFAIGQGVNFIGANLHQPTERFSGSGIYASDRTIAFRNSIVSSTSALLMGDLPAKPKKINRIDVVFSLEDEAPLKAPDFKSEVFGDMYNFIGLTKDEDTVMVCDGITCCHLSYKRSQSEKESNENFVLGAFRGLHTKEGTYFIEVCAFMKCAGQSKKSCGESMSTSVTHFSTFNLTGNFSTSYVYPQVTTDGLDPAAGQWQYDGKSITSEGTVKPFLAAIFFSRRYDLDFKSQGWDQLHCNLLLLLLLQILLLQGWIQDF